MGSNFAVRAASAWELQQFRDTSIAVYSARINQAVFGASVDNITYDSGSGTVADIIPGMFCWIGSAPGLNDKGVCIIRDQASATVIYILPNDKIHFADNDYITIYSRPGQSAKLGLAIHAPATVYTARVNQSFAEQNIAEIIYDGGSGTLAEVLPHMTMFIGSAAGLSDRAIVRVRKAPTATVFYISPLSTSKIQNDDYITIINEFNLQQRDISTVNNTVQMDYDIEYGSYLNGGVFPRIAPLVSVRKLASGTVRFTPPSPALSAAYDGSTIVSYLYAFPGASASGNLDSGTGTAYADYTASGQYRWSCAITDSLGRVTTSYRWVFVDPPAQDFTLDSSPSGDYESGDWSFSITLHSGATLSSVRDRALCTLYAEDYYSGYPISIGRIVNYEVILCTGWIDGETIEYDSESGYVTFTVRGAAYWMSRIRAFPFELQDTSTVPTSWKQLTNMTVDTALAHLLWWTTTAPFMMDVFFTGDTTRVKVLTQPSGNLLAQLNSVCTNTLMAHVLVNNLGQIYIEIDSQVISSAARAAIPVVMDITTADYIAPLDIERITTDAASMIDFGALSAYDGSVSPLVYSRAPGLIPNHYGEIRPYNNYIVADQSEANRIAGCLLAVENNPYIPIDINFAANNRLLDIAPRMYCTMTIAADDNPRGIALTAVRLIPRAVSYKYEDGQILTSATFEFEAIGADGVIYTPPSADDLNVDDYGIPPIGAVDFPPLNDWFPPVVPPSVDTPCNNMLPNSYQLKWDKTEIRGDDTDRIARIYFPCKLRDPAIGLDSTMARGVHTFGDAASEYTIYAIKDGARILTLTGNTWTPTSNTEIDGFELELNAGLGASVTYVPEDVIASGTANANDSDGVLFSTPVGYVCIEGTGGSFDDHGPHSDSWNFDMATDVSTFSGNIGRRVFDNNFGNPTYDIFNLDLPVGYLYAEAVDSSHGRTYWLADGGDHRFRCYDFNNPAFYVDNTGSLGFILRNARADGRRITLGTAIIYDVCAL